jgi:hypothetical protein
MFKEPARKDKEDDSAEVPSGKEEVFVKEPDKSALKSNVGTRRATLVYPGRVLIKGTPSGTEYDFRGIGAQLDVKIEDVEYLSSRMYGGGCCGSTNKARPYVEFEQ